MSPTKSCRSFWLFNSVAAFAFAASADTAAAQTHVLYSQESATTVSIATALRTYAVTTTSPRAAKTFASHACSSENSAHEKNVDDLFSFGSFAMQAGQNAEAIAAFEDLLKLRVDSTAALGNLTLLYLKEGNTAKAIQSFKKAKTLGDANCGIVTRNGSGGLQFP